MGESKAYSRAGVASREPLLAERLGLTADSAVAVRGEVPVPELAEALADVGRVLPWDAEVVVTVVGTPDQLDGLPVWLVECGVVAPTWVVHGAALAGEAGEASVRDALRDAGFTTIGSCAVADGWQAVRAVPPRLA
ncbi:hypothetical protein GE115_09340 [Agromyces sp. CFH 90414]|uniref:Uncharacterized protein n=1 Tax=Agromyces agglutinans TaxID=2662258 RepID=A0A6I2F5X2_9MICO|nr:hypothetical protein [Agromyces agglutinans]MRG60072.1 hypothetical protein [Agromyces agglutinans]